MSSDLHGSAATAAPAGRSDPGSAAPTRLVLLGLACMLLYWVPNHVRDWQDGLRPFHDFRAILTGFAAGFSPDAYHIGAGVGLPFVYPPLILRIGTLGPAPEPAAAAALYLALAIAAVAALAFVQLRYARFLTVSPSLMVLIMLGGFTGAAITAVLSGNPGTILTAMLAIGLIWLPRSGRTGLVCFQLLVFCASLLKPYLAVWAAAPLILAGDRRNAAGALATVLAVAATLALQWLWWAELFERYVVALGQFRDFGSGFPAALGWLIERFLSAALPSPALAALWLAYGGTVLALALRAATSLRRSGQSLLLCAYVLVTVLLLLPRIKIYDVFCAVAPALALAWAALAGGRAVWDVRHILLALILLPFANRYLDEMAEFIRLQFDYLVLGAIWMLATVRAQRGWLLGAQVEAGVVARGTGGYKRTT